MWQHSMYRILPQQSIVGLTGHADIVRRFGRIEFTPGYVLPATLSTYRWSTVKVMA
jgi:hypothetical protein